MMVLAAITAAGQELTIKLWDGVAAGSGNWSYKESFRLNAKQDRIIRNVTEPDLLAFVPDKKNANGTAVIIAPGGGFRMLSYDNEGTKVAEWFRQRGVAAFVLKYRLQNMPAPVRPPWNNTQNETRTFAESLAADPDLTAISLLAIEDGKQAMRIVAGRAAEFGISADRIGFMGFS